MIRKRTKPVSEDRPVRESSMDVSALLAASQAVNSVLGVEESLSVVLGAAKQLCGAHEGSVMLLDSDGFLRILASEGISEQIARDTRIGPGEGVSGRVAYSGEAQMITGDLNRGADQTQVAPGRHLRSAISVPLKAAGRTVGVLNLNLVQGERVFTQDDLRLAQIFGEQAAMAIHKATLLEEANRRSIDLALLLEAGRELMGLLDLETLLNRILDSATRIVGGASGFIAVFDQAAAKVTMAVFAGIERSSFREVLADPGFSQMFGNPSDAAIAGESAPSVLASAPAGTHPVVGSIRGEGKTRAVVVAFGRPDPERSRLFHTFISQASLAIRNAQLYEAVGRKEQELTSIVHSIPNPVVVVDRSGDLVAANNTAEELFGFSADFQKGQTVKGLLQEPELENLLLSEEGVLLEVSLGVPVPKVWKARASRLFSQSSSMAGRILVMEDVTTERDMEKLKADFVAVIGHELRTPITLIKGFVKTLMRKSDVLSGEQLTDALETIESQTTRLERLIEDLLYVSRIETSRQPLLLTETDLSGLAKRLLLEFQSANAGRTFALSAPQALMATFDAIKIEQVIYHLVDNAVKFSQPDSPITVELKDQHDSITVAVIDKGIGILSADLPTLFERFHQVDITSTRKVGGMGVGLYICKTLIDAHGGKIKVDSVWDKGSTFTFSLPKNLALQAHPIKLNSDVAVQ
ncbi:MAG: ATP-binding protein [Actinomycetota bacterium]|nr:GAF domain-containing protein [Actinomycetota bacterium]